MLRVSFLLLGLLATCLALTCEDLGLRTRNAHPIVFHFSYNESRIPSRDGSAFIYASTGEADTSLTSSVSCEDGEDFLVVTSTGIPDHNVGQFPFRRDTTGEGHPDNPNGMSEQTYRFRLPKTLKKKATMPEPITKDQSALPMGPVGIALNGVPFFNLYNSRREDAVNPLSNGYEVMDLCMGHPQMNGAYHYHYTLSKSGCLFEDTPGQHSPKIG